MFLRFQARRVLALLLPWLVAGGCAAQPTTVLLHIGAAPGLTMASVSVAVSLGNRVVVPDQMLPSTTNNIVALPGTVEIWLPDVAADGLILVHGTPLGGTTIIAATPFHTMPGQQVDASVMLGTPTSAGDLQGLRDLGPGVDLTGTDGGVIGFDSGAAVDLATPPLPDAGGADFAMPGLGVVAQDTFVRADQALWGRASDGQLWGADANAHNAFAIAKNAGVIVSPSNKDDESAILGPIVSNADVLVTGSINTFNNGSEIGPTARYTNSNNFYKAVINGSVLKIVLKVNGNSTDVVTTPFSASGGTSYSIRFQLTGSALTARAWPSGSPEPAGWMVSTIDSTFASGYCGIRVVFNSMTTASFTSFIATAF